MYWAKRFEVPVERLAAAVALAGDAVDAVTAELDRQAQERSPPR